VTVWSFACPGWEDRLRAGKSLLPALPLDAAEASRAVAIFDKLRLPDVPGQPTMREAAGDWQRDIVRAIFGSMIEGNRMVPEVFAMLPKKNSKTTGGAALTLTAFLMNSRPRAELIYVGPTQEVADLAFQQTVGMIEADEYLTKRFHVAHHTKTITDRRNKARLKVKTFDMKVVTGSKPIWILLDEVHLMSTISGAARIIGQIRGGMLPNPEAVLVMITTQSDEPPAGAFKAELEYARGVRDGRITDGRVLPVLYEFPISMQEDGSWRDPANWPMVLPNLGRSITIERLIQDYAAAREKGDEEERRWASQHLNVEIGIALGSDAWVGARYWTDATDPELASLDHWRALNRLMERCDVAVCGIDGGGLDDLYGAAVVGRDKTTRDWLLWAHAWAHPDVLDRRKEIAPRLMDFVASGELTLCDDPTQDVREVADLVAMVRDAGLLPDKNAVGLDPMGVAALVDELAAREIGGEMVIAIPQGFRLTGAVWGTERKLKDGTLWHCGGLLMPWVVGNAKTEQRGNAVLITKQVAGKAKIDPLIAAFNAVMLMSRNPEAAGGKSFWETMAAPAA
jgi:phage terminase large subunit-like protein